LEWDGIIESLGVGAYSPYQVINLGKAMKEGYLTLSEEEAKNLVRLPPREGWGWTGLVRDSLAPSLPESRLFTEATMVVYNDMVKSDEEVTPIHVPFRPGHAVNYFPGYIDYFITFQFLRGGVFNTLVKDVLMELDIPGKATSKDYERALRIVAEKYLKLAQLTISPLLDLLEKHGFERGKEMIEKAYLRDKLLKEEVDPTGTRLPRLELHREGGLIDERIVVTGHGVVTQQTQELTPTHIRLTANAYRAACNFAQHVGGDPELVEKCRREALQLESYIEPQSEE
jgi:hypothetical protein